MAKAKLGIRPIIDGRWGGVRESLEEKTMNMALAAKKLIEENVFYSDGTPFEGDPRYVLRRAIKKAADMGYSCNVGPEC